MPRICALDGCTRKHFCKGWCRPHYGRWHKYGDPGPVEIRVWRGDPYERIMKSIDTSAGPDACHLWTGYRRAGAYGYAMINGAPHPVHRWLLGYARGKLLEPGELACHHCDNPPCCNLAHLYVGDVFTNARDRKERGVYAPGGQYNAAKTHCVRGHEYTLENTRVYSGSRFCRECARLAGQIRRMKCKA